MDLLMPFAKHVAGINTISIDRDTRTELSEQLKSPALIVANHPTDMDPILLR
ncbi:MAG: hypothetical protein RLZ42_675, partial [Armatimonadota bacterium]